MATDVEEMHPPFADTFFCGIFFVVVTATTEADGARSAAAPVAEKEG